MNFLFKFVNGKKSNTYDINVLTNYFKKIFIKDF